MNLNFPLLQTISSSGAGLLDAGWHWINMNEARMLYRYVRIDPIISIIHEVTTNSLSSGQIQISRESKTSSTFAAGASRDTGDRLIVPSAAEEAEMSARSQLLARWGRDCMLLDTAIGFFPNAAVATDTEEQASTKETMKPVILNIDIIEIMHRVDSFNRHSWRFFEPLPPGCEASNCEFPYRWEIFNVKVLGSEMPDNYGNLISKAKRIYYGEWRIYQNKVEQTMVADRERAHPTLIIQMPEQHTDADRVNPAEPVNKENTPHAKYIHNLIQEHNSGLHCMGGVYGDWNGPTNRTTPNKGEIKQGDFNQFELETGKQYVPAHMAEAPQELHVARLAYIESVCLSFGIPVSMLSAGDTSGKAKLNSQTAGPETARIFRDAQLNRKLTLECNIRIMYQWIYGPLHVEKLVRQTLERKSKEFKMGKRKRGGIDEEDDPDEIDSESDRLLEETEKELSISKLNREANSVRVEIPCFTDMQEILTLSQQGILKYSAVCRLVANRTGMSLDSYKERQTLTDEQQIIYGVQPKPEPAASSSKSKPKKKSKTKK